MDAAAAELGGILALKEAGGKALKAFLWGEKSRFHLTPDGRRREINTPCRNTADHEAATHVKRCPSCHHKTSGRRYLTWVADLNGPSLSEYVNDGMDPSDLCFKLNKKKKYPDVIKWLKEAAVSMSAQLWPWCSHTSLFLLKKKVCEGCFSATSQAPRQCFPATGEVIRHRRGLIIFFPLPLCFSTPRHLVANQNTIIEAISCTSCLLLEATPQ